MRLAGQAKLGFFPIHPAAIDGLLAHLRCRPPDPLKQPDAIHVLDPCAGEGLALGQLREGLGVTPEQAYAVELDKARADKVREHNPGSRVLGPASFLGVQVTGASFGLAYVNPPFDHELGGGRREEQAFAERATRLLVPKGILVLVCPFGALHGNRSFCTFLDSSYEKPIKILRKRHDVVAIPLTDPAEEALPLKGLVRLRDSETGATRVFDAADPDFRKAWGRRILAAGQRDPKEVFRTAGIDSIPLRTDEPYERPLVRFFQERERRKGAGR